MGMICGDHNRYLRSHALLILFRIRAYIVDWTEYDYRVHLHRVHGSPGHLMEDRSWDIDRVEHYGSAIHRVSALHVLSDPYM